MHHDRDVAGRVMETSRACFSSFNTVDIILNHITGELSVHRDRDISALHVKRAKQAFARAERNLVRSFVEAQTNMQYCLHRWRSTMESVVAAFAKGKASGKRLGSSRGCRHKGCGRRWGVKAPTRECRSSIHFLIGAGTVVDRILEAAGNAPSPSVRVQVFPAHTGVSRAIAAPFETTNGAARHANFFGYPHVYLSLGFCVEIRLGDIQGTKLEVGLVKAALGIFAE